MNAADLIPVGRNMKRWQFWKKNSCPRCLQEDETTAGSASHRSSEPLVNELQQAAPTSEDPPQLLIDARAWMTVTIPTQRIVPPDLCGAVQAQNFLGWNQFLKGRIAKDWAPIQAANFARRRLRNTGKTWSAGLTSAI
jgi:hypothetical protein